MRHALRAQGGFVLSQPVKEFLPVHGALYTTKRPCRTAKTRPTLHVISAQKRRCPSMT
jgi:hypothetical protein